MGFGHLYGRIVTAALGALLGVCVFLAGAKFIRNRAMVLSLLVRAQGALFAVLMGTMAAVGVFRGFAKLPQNYGIVELWNYGNEALGIDGEAQFHNASMSQLHNSIISESDVSNGWRVVETRESREIVRRDSFANPQIHALWLARGGYKDKTRIAPSGWSFPWRDGILDGITVLSRGEIRPDVRTRYFPQPFETPLAVVPSFNWHLLPGGVSNVFWHAVSPSNSLVVTWENSPVGLDVNCITNFQAELFADGSFEYRYDDRMVGYSRVHPLDLDFDGLPNAIDPAPETPLDTSAWNQSDAWAAVAFPDNAAEIAVAGGYLAWAAQRASDPNRRLVSLGVASPGGRWPVCVDVGIGPVMAYGSSDLLYALDCGAQVPFSLSDGELDECAIVELCNYGNEALGIGGEAQFHNATFTHLHNFTIPQSSNCAFPYECMIGDVTVHLDTPRTGWLRRIAEVSVDAPNLTHLYPGSSAQLAAVVTNCHADAYLGCTWHGGAGISFSDANSLTTTVTYASSSQVQWATNNAYLVTNYAGGYSLTNAVWFTVGVNLEPTPSFTIDCQEVFFLNDADVLDGGATNRPERIRPVTFNVQALHGTSGTILVSVEGTANPVVCYVENGVTNRVNPMTSLPISVTDSFACMGQCTVYVSCAHVGAGTISATLHTDGGETLAATSSFKCIEPLRKLVTTEKIDGRFINPSRLVMGTNAVLQVGVNGDFNATNVHWHVVSGAADLSPANGFTTTVTPTGTNEDVVVEARFNGDEIQPRFVLPVVEPRRIPIRFFVVKPPADQKKKEWTDSKIHTMLDKANEIYTQVGIRFELLGTPAYVGTTNDWNIVLGTNYVNKFGMKRWRYSSECRALLDNYTAADCVEVYFIGSILYPKDYVAATPPYGVVVSKQASITTLAHELGHVLGLEDCYVRFNRRDGMVASIIRADEPVDGGFFLFGACDWGMERGRGFYGKDDSKLVTMRRMLMHGTGTNERMDIPAGNVISLSLDARTELEFGTYNPKVGADHIKQENQEVYSR